MIETYNEVFLSYHPLERPALVKPETTSEEIPATRPDLRTYRSCAILIGPHDLSDPDWATRPYLAEALTRAQRDQRFGLFARDRAFQLYLVLLPGLPDPFDPDLLPPGLQNLPWLDLRATATGPRTQDEIQKLLLNSPHPAALALKAALDEGSATSNAAFPGLLPFEENQAHLLQGREAAIQRLREKLKATRLLAVVGGIGSGKSSLVRAGLVPALRQATPDTFVTLFRPGDRPLTTLAGLLARRFDLPVPALRSRLQTDPHTLSQLTGREGGSTGPNLWIVDQLEDIFRPGLDLAERDSFLAALLHAADTPTGNNTVVLTLPTDRLTDCAVHTGLAQALASATCRYEVGLPEDWAGLIEGQCRAAGLTLEPDLLGTLLDDLAELKPQMQALRLPLLQYSLWELYQTRQEDRLTGRAYQECGGLAQALPGRAEKTFQALTPAQQELTRRLFLEEWAGDSSVQKQKLPINAPSTTLSNGEQGLERDEADGEEESLAAFNASAFEANERTLAPSSRLASVLRPVTPLIRPPQPGPGPILAVFSAANLLQKPASGSAVPYSPASLRLGWPRLAEWHRQNEADRAVAERLTAAARAWQDENQAPGRLYAGFDLAQAQDSAARIVPAPGLLENEFLRQSKQADSRPERAILLTLALVLAVVSLIAFFALVQLGRVSSERDKARDDLATARALPGLSNLSIESGFDSTSRGLPTPLLVWRRIEPTVLTWPAGEASQPSGLRNRPVYPPTTQAEARIGGYIGRNSDSQLSTPTASASPMPTP